MQEEGEEEGEEEEEEELLSVLLVTEPLLIFWPFLNISLLI